MIFGLDFNVLLCFEPDKTIWPEYYKRTMNIAYQRRKHIKLLIFSFDSLDFVLEKHKFDLFISDYTLHYQFESKQYLQTFANNLAKYSNAGCSF